MHFLLLGEGPSDFGSKDLDGSLKPGPMARLLDVFREKEDRSFSPLDFTLLTRSDAKREMKNPRRIRRRQAEGGDSDVYRTAQWLAEKAMQLSRSCGAVFFKDADRTRSQQGNVGILAEKAMSDGFASRLFEAGVPMVPNPRQEAWLLGYYQKWLPDCRVYHNCKRFESLSGNDRAVFRNNAKMLLDSALSNAHKEYSDIGDEITSIDWNRIDMPSLSRFRNRLSEVLKLCS